MIVRGIKARPNVTTVALSGPLSVIIIWIITAVAGSPPPEVCAAIAAVVAAVSVECGSIIRNGNGGKKETA